MKAAASFFVGWMGALFLLFTGVQAQERIIDFHAYIVVQENGSLTVTETIRIRAEGDVFRRGIVRNFPLYRYHHDSNRPVRNGFEIESVTRDGRPEPYHTENAYRQVGIYVGSEDVFLDIGREYTYALTYRTTRQIGFFDDFDELYWNVNGNGWALPFDKISATVVLPAAAKGNVVQFTAYTGYDGDTGNDFIATETENGDIYFETTRRLNSYEGMTIGVGWPKGIVAPPTAEELAEENFWRNLGQNVIFGGALLTALYYIFFWFRVGRDPQKGVIFPRFTPPDYSPAAMRYIREMRFDDTIFSTALVTAAVKGWLTIEREKRRTYTLHKTGEEVAKTPLTPEESAAFKALLSARNSLKMSQKHHSTFSKARSSLQEQLRKAYHGKLFKKNTGYFAAGIILSMAVSVIGVILVAMFGDYTADAIGSFVLASIFGLLVAAFLFSFIRAVRGLLSKFTWLRLIGTLLLGIVVIPGCVLYLAVLYWAVWPVSPLLFLGFVIIFVVNVFLGPLLKAPTIEGRAVMDEIEGFRLFLNATEKDRMEFLHPPDRTPELFEKYLPHAMALGVENGWADQFTDVFAGLYDDNHGYQPSFYRGSAAQFNAARFSLEMGSSFTNSLSSSSTSPSSGSGGSGGGGSSGGGGGGGGGGGW